MSHETILELLQDNLNKHMEICDLKRKVKKLTAENERLRKAGDAMAESINFDDQRAWEDWGNQGKSLLRDCVIDWITAKREADAS